MSNPIIPANPMPNAVDQFPVEADHDPAFGDKSGLNRLGIGHVPLKPIEEVARTIMADGCGCTIESGERVFCDDPRLDTWAAGETCGCRRAAHAALSHLASRGMLNVDALHAFRAEEREHE